MCASVDSTNLHGAGKYSFWENLREDNNIKVLIEVV
jgi:hypothetical protein